MTYACPVCGIDDKYAYLRCYDGGCPDGRDQHPVVYHDPYAGPSKAAWWFFSLLIGSAVALVVAVFLLLFVAVPGHAHSDKGFHPDHATTQWFDRLMRPDFPDSACCGKADFYPVSRYWENKDKNGTPTGTWSAEIADGSALRYPDGTYRPYIPTGTIVEVYDGKVNKLEDDLDNPTDTTWIAMRVINGEASSVYCLIRHPSGN